MCDLTTPAVIATIKKFMKQKCIALLWLGTPCQTWSRARRWDGGPRPLCEDHALYGRGGLNAQDQQKVAVGNLLACITCDLCTFASELGIRWVVENHSHQEFGSLTKSLFCNGRVLSYKRSISVLMGCRGEGLLVCFHMPSTAFQMCSNAALRGMVAANTRAESHIALAGKNANGMWLTRVCTALPA